MKIDEKLLDKYIDENFSDCKPLTKEDGKAVSETFGFASFCLNAACKEFTASIKAEFPWLFGGDAV
mgnify:CR=1 FL=1